MVQITLRTGKNYISLPQIPSPADPETIFGRDVEVWEYADGSWKRPTKLECGKGYYVYLPWGTRKISITGVSCVVTINDLLTVYNSFESGWALIGPGTDTLDVRNTELEGHVLKYSYTDDKWYYTDILEPTKAYWLEKPLPCDAPTTHFSSVRELLKYFDTDNDGFLTPADAERARDMLRNGEITETEFELVDNLFAYPATDIRYGNIEARCPCQETCELSCQEACELSCQETCEFSCQEACEVSCQEACELSCQETCEFSCQEACEVSCQEACELSCQETCEFSCQEACEVSCQEACELSCQGSCEIECQQALKTIGCPIAVIADGTELTDNLGPIREFRDKVLNKYGFKWFVNMYYGFITEKLSPFLYKHQTFRRIGRIVLRGLLWFLQRRRK